jgi:2-polyprenyl-6-methoxyphenol hydroxylase-like FAD-dependent oxidoreductase
MTTQDSKKGIRTIAIIGGGIAGLALGQLLRDCPDLKVTIYERDESPISRRQGYYIGINEHGLKVLEPLFSTVPNLKEELEMNDLSAFGILDEAMQELLVVGEGGLKLGSLVHRWNFRNLLTQGLDIQWNKQIEAIEEKEDSVIVIFKDGTRIEADLLVGADGARSRIRSYRYPSIEYQPLNFTSINGVLDITPETTSYPTREMLKKWALRVLGKNGHTMLMLPFHETKDGESPRWRLLWSLSFPGCREDWKEFFKDDDTEDLDTLEQSKELQHIGIQRALENFDAEAVADAIRSTKVEEFMGMRQVHSTDPDVVRNSLSGKPSRVVLLGDAVHAMTTHGGNGANTALQDADDLAKAIKELTSSFSYLPLLDYERVMLQRGAQAVKNSLMSTNMIHATGNWASLRRITIKTIATGVKIYRGIRSFFTNQ